MSQRIHIKPAAGLRVIDPATNLPVPDEGAYVVPNQYWNRRLRDGDVIRAAKATGRKSEPKQKDDESEEG